MKCRGRIRPLVLLKMQPSWGLGQRIGRNTCFLTGGGRLTGPKLSSGVTRSEAGAVDSKKFTVTFSKPVTVANPALGYQFYLNGNPQAVTWVAGPTTGVTELTYTLGAPTWDLFVGFSLEFCIVEPDKGSWTETSSGNEIKPTCTNIVNLYEPPIALSATAVDSTHVVVNFSAEGLTPPDLITDTGSYYPTDPNGTLIKNCTTGAELTIVSDTNISDTQIEYEVLEPINEGDEVQWTTQGVDPVDCGANLFDGPEPWLGQNNWTDNLDGTWTIPVATGNSDLYKEINGSLIEGNTYRITFDIVESIADQATIRCGSTIQTLGVRPVGSYTEDVVCAKGATRTGFRVQINGHYTVRTDTATCYDLGVV